MLRYFLRRLLIAVPIFLGITIAVYTLSCLAPGNVVDLLSAEGSMSDEAYQAALEQYDLDKPIPVRYALWLGRLLKGDLGVSAATNQPVSAMIGSRVAATLTLSGTVLVISVLLSLVLGVLSAYKPYSVWDNISSALAFMGASVPNFFLSLILIYIFSARLDLLPSQGMYTTNAEPSLPDLIRHMILPVTVLCVQLMGSYIKQTRGSVLEVLGEEHIKTARSKGLSELRVLICHGLRNALIPIVTTVGMNVPFLIGGAVVTEQIFAWPGLGALMMQAISNRDYNLIMGITVIIAVAVLVANILFDMLYAWLDPRISVSTGGDAA